MIKTFNKSNLNQVRTDINSALKEVENKYGIKLDIGNISYNGSLFTTKLKAFATGGDDTNVGKIEWDRNCYKFGSKKGDFGRTIKFMGETFTVSGIKPRSSKYPVLADKGGKTYKLPVGALR